ncbi:MAG: peroxiredoxin-like family protein [Bacteroidota bacterium]
MTRPIPKHKAPELAFSLLDGTTWELGQHKPKTFNVIVFYRGLHCPLCKKYLQQLETLLPEFKAQGADVIAISMDTEKRARLSRKDWGLTNLTLGYGLPLEVAKAWGLYLSKAVKQGEPDVFSEPGLFLIDSEGLVYYAAINSNPWGRPYLPSFVKAVNYIINAKYPARGELV